MLITSNRLQSVFVWQQQYAADSDLFAQRRQVCVIFSARAGIDSSSLDDCFAGEPGPVITKVTGGKGSVDSLSVRTRLLFCCSAFSGAPIHEDMVVVEEFPLLLVTPSATGNLMKAMIEYV